MYKSALKEKETSAGYKMKQMKKKEKYLILFSFYIFFSFMSKFVGATQRDGWWN